MCIRDSPDVEGASELPDLGIVLQQESQRRGMPYPQWVPQASAQDWQRLGQAYLQRTARWRTPRPRMTDKQPDNWKHAGILRAMLPGATVIETRRDPLETAWSCFKQQFYSQPHFANTLADIATYMQGCQRTMDSVRERDPAHIHLHHYEALLDAPEAQIRALLAPVSYTHLDVYKRQASNRRSPKKRLSTNRPKLLARAGSRLSLIHI